MSAGPFISRESWETGSFSDLSLFETETLTHTHTHTQKKKKQLQVTSHKNSPSHRNRVFLYVSFILNPPMSMHLHPALNRIGNPWMESVVR